jgi:hypothetical protein
MTLCSLLALAAENAPSRKALRITEMAVTTKIARGNPIDSVHRISATSVKALYCFTRIRRTDDGETTIKHVWYHDGKMEREISLPVRGELWRTYSKRPVDASSKGSWRVDALSADGTLLKSVEFRVN